jgi:hypothetical protein
MFTDGEFDNAEVLKIVGLDKWKIDISWGIM